MNTEKIMKFLTAEERQLMLADAIERLKKGEVVNLRDASGSAIDICIGDFRALGMAEKNTWRTGMNWTWKGPGTINLHGEILKPGDRSVEIDMDWS
jgi:hypothetical protein